MVRQLPPHMAMTEEDHRLASYNSEVARGIMHTAEWQERMRVAQENWDQRIAASMQASGATPMPGGGWLVTE